MRNTIKILIISNLLLISGTIYAAANVTIANTLISKVSSATEGIIYITPGSYADPNSCGSLTPGLSTDDPNFREMHVLAMAALTTGFTVRIIISGTECLGNYPKILFIEVEKP